LSKDAAPTDVAGKLGSARPALIALSLGVLMTVLDATAVYVALPTIRQDLRLDETQLVWVVNAFTLAFSGSLLLAGRLGDVYGHRKLFLLGIATFTLASLVCGLAPSLAALVVGRAAQGVSGAMVSSLALSLIMEMFPDSVARAKAMGAYSFISVLGGSTGLLLGGALTSAFNWHWIFLVNLPVGVVVYALCWAWLPRAQEKVERRRLDVWGALVLTSFLVLAVYAVVNRNEAGTTFAIAVALPACVVLLGIFLIIESRVAEPLMPLGFFRSSSVVISNVVRVLWAASGSASFFTALYVQSVLGHGPMEISLTFLPAAFATAVFALGFSARLVVKFGITGPLTVGLVLGATGLALIARLPIDGSVLIDVIPGSILLGISGGLAATPLLLATMINVGPREAGLASGVVGTVWTVGGALGLAVLASVADAHTERLLAAGAPYLVALTSGYRLALLLAASCVVAATVIGVALLPKVERASITESAIPGA
jgi:EmrB/QacA subfamily drug resistance transporter